LSGQIDIRISKWPPQRHGFIALHTGLTVDFEAVSILREHGADIPSRVPTGAFVGAIEILGVRRLCDTPEELCRVMGTPRLAVDFADILYGLRGEVGREVSRFAWILGNPLRFDPPLAAAGRRGSWAIPPQEGRVLRPLVVAHAVACPKLPPA
jgi:hypothetical protein